MKKITEVFDYVLDTLNLSTKSELDKINELISKESGIELIKNGDEFVIKNVPYKKRKKVYNKFYSDPVDGDWYKILTKKGSINSATIACGGQTHNGVEEITSMMINIEEALNFAKEYQNELHEKTTDEKAWREKHKQTLCNHENLEHFKESIYNNSAPMEGDICLDCGKHINVSCWG